MRHKRVKSSSFKEQIAEAARYLAESKSYIFAVAMIFVAGAVAGIAYSNQLGFLDDILKEILGKVEGLSAWGIIIFILANNIKASLIGLILGIFFGIFPVVNAFSNGLILGYVANGVVGKEGLQELWRILPHGVFEIPAVFISLALGLKLGMFVFSRSKGKELVRRARNSMIIFVLLVLPLLILAAVIEGLLISLYK